MIIVCFLSVCIKFSKENFKWPKGFFTFWNYLHTKHELFRNISKAWQNPKVCKNSSVSKNLIVKNINESAFLSTWFWSKRIKKMLIHNFKKGVNNWIHRNCGTKLSKKLVSRKIKIRLTSTVGSMKFSEDTDPTEYCFCQITKLVFCVNIASYERNSRIQP